MAMEIFYRTIRGPVGLMLIAAFQVCFTRQLTVVCFRVWQLWKWM